MFKPRQPKTLRDYLLRALVSTLAGMAFLTCAALLNDGVVNGALDSPTVDALPSPPISQEPTRIERMIKSGKCWTENGPIGVIPGHAWFTLPGEGLTYGASDVAFAIVFGEDNEMGSGDERPGKVSAFCR